MKKIILSLVMLCSMTTVWAGEGDGSQLHPYTGEWQASDLVPRIKVGDHLASDCVITNGDISVIDTKLDAKVVDNRWEWTVGEPIDETYWDPYFLYCCYNTDVAERQEHTFIITDITLPADPGNMHICHIKGYYSGLYEKTGLGSKLEPYDGEWTMSDLLQSLKPGDYLSHDCVITREQGVFSVLDDKLNGFALSDKSSWTIANTMDEAVIHLEDWFKIYTYYILNNTQEELDHHMFLVTNILLDFDGPNSIRILGHFTGRYDSPIEGFETVKSYDDLKFKLSCNSYAKILLMDDIYLSDGGGRSLLDTFHGTLDGNGFTIWAARPEVPHDGGGHYHCYSLFNNLDGATVKNLTFRDIRVQSGSEGHQAVLSSYIKNGSHIENIVFDNVSVWSDKAVVGSVTASVSNSTLKNIKVFRSDFTTDSHTVGAITGFANLSSMIDCYVDDQTCVCSDGDTTYGNAGGIAGNCIESNRFENCVNCAFVAGNDQYIGGIAGYDERGHFVRCINAGMVISLLQSDVPAFFEKYKNMDMGSFTRPYQGVDYKIRFLNSDQISKVRSDEYLGGIIGRGWRSHPTYCANFGSLYTTGFAAGIVGDANWVDMLYCLSDFVGGGKGGKIYGLIRGENANTKGACIRDCLSATPYQPITCMPTVFDSWTEDNFTLCPGIDQRNESRIYMQSVTEEEVRCGLLVPRMGYGWIQNLGTDPTPVPYLDGAQGYLYHTRTITDAIGTICVPFPLRSDDEKQYYTFSHSTNNLNGDVLLQFVYAEKVEAGVPALFFSNEKGEVAFYNSDKWEIADEPVTPAPDDWSMMGTYQLQVFEEPDSKNVFFVSGGEVWNARRTTISPFRAYLHGPAIGEDPSPGGYQARTIRFVLEDESGEATAIHLVYDSENDAFRYDDAPSAASGAKAYTLFGTEAGEGYRGIVVRGGKKVLQ